MLPKLKDTPKFKKDLYKFKKLLNSINDPKIRKTGEELLNNIINYSNIIDQEHSISNTNIDPKRLRSSIEELSKARLKLDKFIKDSKGL